MKKKCLSFKASEEGAQTVAQTVGPNKMLAKTHLGVRCSAADAEPPPFWLWDFQYYWRRLLPVQQVVQIENICKFN